MDSLLEKQNSLNEIEFKRILNVYESSLGAVVVFTTVRNGVLI